MMLHVLRCVICIDHSHERKFRVLCLCVKRKFVDWDVPAAMLGLLGVA